MGNLVRRGHEDLGTPTCPECGCTNIVWDHACHTWPQGGGWMSCIRCDSAMRYSCGCCDWSFTHGLNPDNPRSAKNEASRPTWLPCPEVPYGDFGICIPYPGTRYIDDDE